MEETFPLFNRLSANPTKWSNTIKQFVGYVYEFILIYFNDFQSYNIHPFHANGLFQYPLKTFGFLMFSRGTERGQWHEMG